MPEFRTVDGRTLVYKHKPNVLGVRISDGVITEKYCPKCSKWRNTSSFYAVNAAGYTRLAGYCSICSCNLGSKYYDEHRTGPRKFIEFSVFNVDGEAHLKCKVCNQPKPLGKFGSSRGKYKRYYSRTCKQCRFERIACGFYDRFVRTHFGETSPQFREIAHAEGRHNKAALCRLWGFPTYRGILAETRKRNIQQLLPGLQASGQTQEGRAA